jgi:predicted N-formylglutamate amidohydrolase
VLWHVDDRLSAPLIARLEAEPDLCVGDNQPYAGQLEGDTLSRHGLRRGLRHVLIEIRQDLIATAEGQRLWAARLAPMFGEIVAATNEAPHG